MMNYPEHSAGQAGLLKTAVTFSLLACAAASYGQQMPARKLAAAMTAVTDQYVDQVDGEKMAEKQIRMMLSGLDPHSTYISPEEVKKSENPLNGSFVGIGIQFIMLNDTVYVSQVSAGGPAAAAGVHSGDRILEVSGTRLSGQRAATGNVLQYMTGPAGSLAELTILRGQQTHTLKVTRNKVQIPSIAAAYMENKETGYISIARFAATTHQEFMEAFSRLKRQGMKDLVLDLQGNGGGYLGAGIEMATEFLQKDQLITRMEGAHIPQKEIRASKQGLYSKGKLVVLLNESTASASEVFCGALQDWDRAVLVGRRSFGKGLVQKPVVLPDSAMIRLTIARYFTPAGRNIQKPYDKEHPEIYQQDLRHRFSDGELAGSSQVKYADSLKFTTLRTGRKVYGGGGITPDLFIPVDTSYYSRWYGTVLNSGIMHKTALQLSIKEGLKLRAAYPDFKDFCSSYQLSEATTAAFIAETKAIGIPFSQSDYDKSALAMRLEYKAAIARAVWGGEEYYLRVLNSGAAAYRQAMQLVSNSSSYEKILNSNKS